MDCASGTIPIGLIKRLEKLKIRGQVKTIQTIALSDRPEYWEESWRLEETPTPVRNYQLTLVLKPLKGVNNNVKEKIIKLTEIIHIILLLIKAERNFWTCFLKVSNFITYNTKSRGYGGGRLDREGVAK